MESYDKIRRAKRLIEEALRWCPAQNEDDFRRVLDRVEDAVRELKGAAGKIEGVLSQCTPYGGNESL